MKNCERSIDAQSIPMPTQAQEAITVRNMQHQFASDAYNLKLQTFAYSSHQQIMENLLAQVTPIDFREKAELDSQEAKIKTRHYLIIVVEELLNLATKNQWGLGRRSNLFYLFNGAYWKALDKDDLRVFLRQVAERMGVEKYTARYVGFSNQLFDQFTDTAYVSPRGSDDGTVRINLTNGTFDISPESQQIREPDAADFLTYQLPFNYEPEAKAPQFECFLNHVQPDQSCQKLLAEYLGYVFVSTSRLKLEKVLLLYGSGANGKSVFFEIVTALFGEENISHYSLKSLTNEPAYCRAHLADTLLNYASEISGKLEADTFKQLASGEPIEARLPHGQPFTMKRYAKLIFNCNTLPTDVEHTPAYFRRFLIVPFSVTIDEIDQDKELAAKIIGSELSGVFNWVLEGLRRLLKQGQFTPCDAVQQQIDSYKKLSDSVRLFLEEYEYQSSTSLNDYIFLKDFYRDYKIYCLEDGLNPVKKPNFQKRLHSIGIKTERKNTGNVVFVQKGPITY